MISHSATVAGLLERTASVHPDRPALLAEDRRWTFAELRRLIIAGAQSLAGRSAGLDGSVAIIGANHPAYIVGFFAAQWLGATTVEVSHHESLGSLERILRDTDPVIVLTDRQDLLSGFEGSCPVESFEHFLQSAEAAGGEATRHPRELRRAAPDAPASILYTSGTTGAPKGVILSQSNLVAVTEAILDYLELTPADRYGQLLPLNHSYGKSNLLTSFAAGASVVLLEDFNDLPQFLNSLSEKRCTAASFVPYHANILLKRSDLSAFDFSSLRIMTFSGNHLPWETIHGLQQALPHLRIFSMYGLTESSTRACYLPPERLFEKRGSCGRPIRGVEMRIVGDDGRRMPAGEIGEVWLRGPNVMQGYYKDPVLTRETLTGGWLHTGDLGWVDEEGFLYLKGRRKDIIKCAGERISAAEIENVLSSHPGVMEAAVVGVPDHILGESVKAFVVPREHFDDTSALRVHCSRNLSHHKIPRRYEFIESLPKTATGKVKKHLLTERRDD